MKATTYSKLLIILLIISNGFTAFLLVKKDKPHKPPFISEKIGLTGDPLKKAKNIELSLFEQLKPLDSKIEKLHAELYFYISANDTKKEDTLKSTISKLILKKDDLLLAHFKKIYLLCNPSQKQQFVTEIKKHFSRPKHPPRK